MHILEALLLIILLCIGIRAAFTDIKYGYIYNRDLFMALVPAAICNCLYYAVFVRDIFLDYMLNIGIVLIVQILLYRTHSYAGGDFKLGMLLAFLYPARMYAAYQGMIGTLFFYIGFAILYGYLYMLVDAVTRAVRGKSGFNGGYVRRFLKNYLISYVRATIYVLAVTMLITLVGRYIYIPSWVAWLVSMFAAWESRRRKVFHYKMLIAAVTGFDVICAVMMRVIPFSVYPETYIFTAVLLVCQMLIGAALYETIDTDHVRKGMILSRVSSALMQNSRVKGLPGISSENLKDRLTEEQAYSVRRWGRTKSGQAQVTIMRKIPFAIFLLMGMMTYFAGWLYLYEI